MNAGQMNAGQMNAGRELSAGAAQLLYSYARCVDEGDLDRMDTLVTDDIQIVRAEGTSRGRGEVRALYAAHRDQGLRLSRHVVTNVEAERLPDGVIQARAYFTVTMVRADGECTQLFGQYRDTLAEIGGRLLFRHKNVIVEHALTLAAVPGRAWAGVDVPD